jgi:hypothetical protein
LDSDFMPLPWDGAGNLRQEHLFPDSVRARRAQPHGPGNAVAAPSLNLESGEERVAQRVEYRV